MTSDLATILGTVGLIGGGTGIAAIIVAINSRKKNKADALSVIEAAASAQVTRMREEAETWRAECIDLRADTAIMRSDLENMKGRIDENDTCQTTLKRQLAILESEKRDLISEVKGLKGRIEELEKENLRLKLEKEEAKG